VNEREFPIFKGIPDCRIVTVTTSSRAIIAFYFFSDIYMILIYYKLYEIFTQYYNINILRRIIVESRWIKKQIISIKLRIIKLKLQLYNSPLLGIWCTISNKYIQKYYIVYTIHNYCNTTWLAEPLWLIRKTCARLI